MDRRVLRYFFFLLLLAPVNTPAQSLLTGNWEGLLTAGNTKLKLILHVRQDSTGLKTTLDSPDQSAFNIPMSRTTISGDTLKISDSKTGVAITAIYQRDKDSLYSDFTQFGARFHINWGRSTATYTFNRPQTPKPPFPYRSEDVTFLNPKANIRLAGTLTVPEGVKNPPVVVLISGSGPQDRNERLLEHQPFLVLSDHLSRNGVAVLRYDDRGIGLSEGNFTSATTYDFASDAGAALEFLRKRTDIDTNKIGLLGHSEGGMIAPIIASANNKTAFIILLAGPGVEIDKLMLKQSEDIALGNNLSRKETDKILHLNRLIYKAIRDTRDTTALLDKLAGILVKENFAGGRIEDCREYARTYFMSPWFVEFVRFSPSKYLQRIKCPVLAVNGSLDKQVNSKMNLSAIRKALTKAKNKDFTVIEMPQLNHLFQEAKTGNQAEYLQIEQTMSPKVLDTVTEWIRKRF